MLMDCEHAEKGEGFNLNTPWDAAMCLINGFSGFLKLSDVNVGISIAAPHRIRSPIV